MLLHLLSTQMLRYKVVKFKRHIYIHLRVAFMFALLIGWPSYVTGCHRLRPPVTECKHLSFDAARVALSDRVSLQNSLGEGGRYDHLAGSLLGLSGMTSNLQLFNQNTRIKYWLVAGRRVFCIGTVDLREWQNIYLDFSIPIIAFQLNSAHNCTQDFIHLHCSRTVCHCDSLMFTVHFSKVRQIASMCCRSKE